MCILSRIKIKNHLFMWRRYQTSVFRDLHIVESFITLIISAYEFSSSSEFSFLTWIQNFRYLHRCMTKLCPDNIIKHQTLKSFSLTIMYLVSICSYKLRNERAKPGNFQKPEEGARVVNLKTLSSHLNDTWCVLQQPELLSFHHAFDPTRLF